MAHMQTSEFKRLSLMDKKASADRMWARVMADVESGRIDKDMIGSAMHLSNLADKALMDYEARSRNHTSAPI